MKTSDKIVQDSTNQIEKLKSECENIHFLNDQSAMDWYKLAEIVSISNEIDANQELINEIQKKPS